MEERITQQNRAPRTPARPPSPARRRVPRGYETIDSILLTEPRIEAIRRELQAILALGCFEVDGESVVVDGFRLRRAGDWADYPTSLSDIFWHLSSVCNFGCEFCYEKGNPPDFPIQSQPRMSTPEEIDTRLRYYDAARGTGIFSVRTAINEPFVNPQAVHYLRKMREAAPDELISFVTNGSYLTAPAVDALAELGPLFFNLSLYSTDPGIRRTVIRDKRIDSAVDACRLLATARVPYMANLVMWPSIPFSDMERTIAYAAEQRATVMRICLGGYSRYLPGDFDHFRVEDFWPKVVAAVEQLRDLYRIPLLIEPNSYVRTDTDAVIDGVVADSPAELAGIRRGDIVIRVDGQVVQTRVQLISALRRGKLSRFRPPGVSAEIGSVSSGGSVATVELLRDGERHVYELNRHDRRAMATYPYGEIAQFEDFLYGLVVTDSLRYSSLKAARKIIDSRQAKRVVLLSSALMYPIVIKMISRTRVFEGVDVVIRVPRNDYFGGNINIGDLLTVDDFVTAIGELVTEIDGPELVLIPASPFATSPWRRDLTGVPWTDIERRTGIPVETIPCAPLVY